MRKVIKLKTIYGSPNGVKHPGDEITVGSHEADALVAGGYGVWVRDVPMDNPPGGGPTIPVQTEPETTALTVDKSTRALRRKGV